MLNYYPGSGLAHETAVLGNSIGHAYPIWAGFPLCKLFGTLLTIKGEPVGTASKLLKNSPDGTSMLIDTWTGVTITAATSTADAVSGKVISVDKTTAGTNQEGYFELYVIKGLNVNVACPSFGKSVSVDTTGQDSIDLSSYF